MQPYNPLIDVLCLVALSAFAASAVMALALLLRRHKRRATPPAPDMHPEPAIMSPATMLPVNGSAPSPALPYAAIPTLLTRAEQSFFAALLAAVPDSLLICPQVRLANLVQPTAQRAKQKQYDFYRIQAKCVDFVLCDRTTTAPRLVIELDDASHIRQDRKERDAFVDAVLATVRLPVLHVRWQHSYDVARLTSDVRHALGMQAGVHAAPQLLHENGWTKPIATGPRQTAVSMQVVAPPNTHAARYVCGTCQGEVRRESTYCNHCGTLLARR